MVYKQLAAAALVLTVINTYTFADTTTQIRFVEAYTIHGAALSDFMGRSVSGAGDLNKDGYDDVLIGAMGVDNPDGTQGQAIVVSGIDGSILYRFQGANSRDYFGDSVSGAGDVNNDGYPDLLVGAPNERVLGAANEYARIFSGRDGSPLYTLTAPTAATDFGSAVSGVGDVNNDGFDDVVIGAYSDDTAGSNAGAATVYSGRDGTILYQFFGENDRNLFGFSVSGAGDLNQDGHADIVIGAKRADKGINTPGSVYIYSGIDGSHLYDRNNALGGAVFYGRKDFDQFGGAVSDAGDVNNDGFPDIIVGAETADVSAISSGAIKVISGIDGSDIYASSFPLNYAIAGDNFNDNFGFAVSGIGDVNQDGFDDMAVGAVEPNNESGYVRIISGADGSQLAKLRGDQRGDYFGASVSDAGDINGDGLPDLVVGAWYGGENNGGYARVFVTQIVPEPTSIAMLGLSGFALIRRRRAMR
ncbi:MAG: FG-GAP-like repeat-containing protein [Phycisphaeraceae bacterium]